MIVIVLQQTARSGDKKIRRNSLTTLHSLPSSQYPDIPVPPLGLDRQTTVPHGFNVSTHSFLYHHAHYTVAHGELRYISRHCYKEITKKIKVFVKLSFQFFDLFILCIKLNDVNKILFIHHCEICQLYYKKF